MMTKKQINVFVRTIYLHDPVVEVYGCNSGEERGLVDLEQDLIILYLSSDMKAEEIMYLAAHQAVHLKMENTNHGPDFYQYLIPLAQEFQIPYETVISLEGGENWEKEHRY